MLIKAEQSELDLHTNTDGSESLKLWLALNKTSNSASKHKAQNIEQHFILSPVQIQSAKKKAE